MKYLAVLLVLTLSAAFGQSRPALVGTWVQDEMGPVLIHARRYEFRADGSHEFVFTSRPRGANDRKVLAREAGTYRVEADRLVVTPKSGASKAVQWRVEKDRYVGNLQLVMTLPDGRLDIYYPE